jgi:aminopeptidase N
MCIKDKKLTYLAPIILLMKNSSLYFYSKKFTLLVLLSMPLFTWQCKSLRQGNEKGKYNAYIDTTDAAYEYSTPVFRETPKRVNDILHTKLDLKFDIAKAHVIGKATITFKPYFYTVNNLELNAVGFQINKIIGLGNLGNEDLKYSYNDDKLIIDLGKYYTRKDTLNIFIDYVAKPDEQAQGSGIAILGDKGLYFINKDGSQPNFPTQIWSQGETQSNSKWFPTIDAPNERMTQEIILTVNKKYTTLSNGLLIAQKENDDGTRTDHWKQSLPAAPYLTMIAVGEYGIVKEKYKNIEVSYYVEPQYVKYAKQIFGDTPEMLAYFSNLLGVEYPWEKYAQIAVREYVSGAMENTSATVFGDDIQRTEKELLDANGNDVIAHELFHQWFGNLVTCESWSNLPLNESFANYSEYIWLTHKYGNDVGDEHLYRDLEIYLNESKTKQVNLIRFYYNDREDMFDGHSYNKGGRILHMLRNYVGDDAFFASLKLYLNNKKFNSAEIADLRLAFEAITGEDLNWFFDQWFMSAGHPELSVSSYFNDTTKQVVLNVRQNQNFNFAPLYKLPLVVEIYTANGRERHEITITKQEENFYFDAKTKPNLVEFDADHMLLAVISEVKSVEEWIYQYKNCSSYFAKSDALRNLKDIKGKSVYDCLLSATNDKFHAIRALASEILFENFSKENTTQLKQTFLTMASKEEKSYLRSYALKYWYKLSVNDETVKEVLVNATNDKSFLVQTMALVWLNKADPDLGFEMAKKFENETNLHMVSAIARIYTDLGSDKENEFFVKNYNRISGFEKYDFIELYGKYLLGRSDEVINTGVNLLEREARNNNIWFIKLNAVNKINQIIDMYAQREMELKGKSDKQNQYQSTILQKEKIKNLLSDIKEAETNQNLIKIYKN